MIPTEPEYQLAVDAAAKKMFSYTDAAKVNGWIWDALSVFQKNTFREAVLPYVHETLAALPDRLEIVEAALDGAVGESVSCGGLTVEADGCFAADVAKRVRAAIKMARP